MITFKFTDWDIVELEKSEFLATLKGKVHDKIINKVFKLAIAKMNLKGNINKDNIDFLEVPPKVLDKTRFAIDNKLHSYMDFIIDDCNRDGFRILHYSINKVIFEKKNDIWICKALVGGIYEKDKKTGN